MRTSDKKALIWNPAKLKSMNLRTDILFRGIDVVDWASFLISPSG